MSNCLSIRSIWSAGVVSPACPDAGREPRRAPAVCRACSSHHLGMRTLTRQRNSHSYSSRHGERSGHLLISLVAHAVDLSLWHDVHGFGILYLSVIAGVMNRNVCA